MTICRQCRNLDSRGFNTGMGTFVVYTPGSSEFWRCKVPMDPVTGEGTVLCYDKNKGNCPDFERPPTVWESLKESFGFGKRSYENTAQTN